MEGDVSNKTIVVLVILTVIISVLGTAVVVMEVTQIEVPQKVSRTSASSEGTLSLTLVPQKEPQVSKSTGMISLEVLPRKS
jgi:hypothetical protein